MIRFLMKKEKVMKIFWKKCVRCLEIVGEYAMQKYGLK